MGHKTLIGGTAYEVKGGRTLVNGTGYKISKGRTLIGGTGYNISFGTFVTITGSGEATYCHAVINGQTYTGATGGIEVSAGDVIVFRLYSAQSSSSGKVTINGAVVATVTGTVIGKSTDYSWTVPEGCTSININLYLAKDTSSGRKLYSTTTVTTA